VRRSKKTVKKKVAATQPRPKQVVTPTEFDDWAESQKKRSGCQTCRYPGVNVTIRGLLESCIRKRAFKFSIHDMRVKINKKHPETDVGQRGLERHLRTCERVLYFQARGRHDV
jgi:hypothetical protein